MSNSDILHYTLIGLGIWLALVIIGHRLDLDQLEEGN